MKLRVRFATDRGPICQKALVDLLALDLTGGDYIGYAKRAAKEYNERLAAEKRALGGRVDRAQTVCARTGEGDI